MRNLQNARNYWQYEAGAQVIHYLREGKFLGGKGGSSWLARRGTVMTPGQWEDKALEFSYGTGAVALTGSEMTEALAFMSLGCAEVFENHMLAEEILDRAGCYLPEEASNVLAEAVEWLLPFPQVNKISRGPSNMRVNSTILSYVKVGELLLIGIKDPKKKRATKESLLILTEAWIDTLARTVGGAILIRTGWTMPEACCYGTHVNESIFIRGGGEPKIIGCTKSPPLAGLSLQNINEKLMSPLLKCMIEVASATATHRIEAKRLPNDMAKSMARLGIKSIRHSPFFCIVTDWCLQQL